MNLCPRDWIFKWMISTLIKMDRKNWIILWSRRMSWMLDESNDSSRCMIYWSVSRLKSNRPSTFSKPATFETEDLLLDDESFFKWSEFETNNWFNKTSFHKSVVHNHCFVIVSFWPPLLLYLSFKRPGSFVWLKNLSIGAHVTEKCSNTFSRPSIKTNNVFELAVNVEN